MVYVMPKSFLVGVLGYYGLVNILFSHFVVECYWKANEEKRRGQKNIQNKAVQTKLNLYIN